MAEKKSESHAKRINEIMQASALLFDKVGYHGASMQMVADAVKLGKPTLYHYFRSKSEILFAIHQQLISQLFASHAAREAKKLPPDQLLEGICTDILSFIHDHPGYVRAFFEHYNELDDEHKSQVRNHRRRYFQMTSDIISDGIKSGLFAKCDPRMATLAFLGVCNWTYQWFPHEKNKDVNKTAKSLCRLFFNGLYK